MKHFKVIRYMDTEEFFLKTSSDSILGQFLFNCPDKIRNAIVRGIFKVSKYLHCYKWVKVTRQ